MQDVQVIGDAKTAATALDPTRARLLAELKEPASAASLAAKLGLPRQKVNYHLRALEDRGLVSVADTRKHGGLTERVLQATAAAYAISPDALGAAAADPRRMDKLSAAYLVAVGGRLVREVSPDTPTLTVDAELKIKDRAAFAEEAARLVTELAQRHHDEAGEPYRLLLASHPIPKGDT